MSTATISSPTFSAVSTASSFDVVSNRSRSSSTNSARSLRWSEEDSDDEIVWDVVSPLPDNLSASFISTTSSIPSAADDDFVLLAPRNRMTRSTTPSAPVNQDNAASDLAEELSALSINPVPSTPTKARQSRRQKAVARALAAERPSSVATTTTTLPSPPSSPKNKKRKRARKVEAGLGSRPIVDDVSESGFSSEQLDDGYDEAVQYLNSFLTNPDDSVNRLTLLQSMIIELGLAGSALPASLTAARAYLKSRAFVNIRDYLAARGQGPDALKDVLHPTRAALVKDIRRKRNQASKQWVKQHGLNVLLVQCFH